MTFDDHLAAAAAQVFAHLGAPAVSGVLVGAAGRVLLDRPDVAAGLTDARAALPDASLQVAKAACVRKPKAGDVFTVGATAWRVVGPARDVEGDGAVWTCDVERVAS